MRLQSNYKSIYKNLEVVLVTLVDHVMLTINHLTHTTINIF